MDCASVRTASDWASGWPEKRIKGLVRTLAQMRTVRRRMPNWATMPVPKQIMVNANPLMTQDTQHNALPSIKFRVIGPPSSCEASPGRPSRGSDSRRDDSTPGRCAGTPVALAILV